MSKVYSAVPVTVPNDKKFSALDPEKQQETPIPQPQRTNGSLKYILFAVVACSLLVVSALRAVYTNFDTIKGMWPKHVGCGNTKTKGGGRDWIVNSDGTISAKHGSEDGDDLVLGVGKSPMVLVKKGDKRQFIFNLEDLKALKDGETRPFSFKSKVGVEEESAFIGKMYTSEKYAVFPNGQKWRYIESVKTMDEENAINVKYVSDQFLSLVNDDLVFDVSYWKYAENVAVNFVGGGNAESPTLLEGGGRSFILNLDDGTIALSPDRDLVLGEGHPAMVLVKRGDPKQIILEKSAEFAEGKIVPAILSSPPGLSLGRKWPGEKVFEEWRYSESTFYYNDEKAILLQYEDNNFIGLPGEDLVFDVSFWKMNEGNTVNFVGGKC